MALAKWMSEILLNAQVAAAEHVRDCDKRRHLFEVAYEEADSEMLLGLNPFFVMNSNNTRITKMPRLAEINLRHSSFEIQTLSPELRQYPFRADF